jgi:hypothetical protein
MTAALRETFPHLTASELYPDLFEDRRSFTLAGDPATCRHYWIRLPLIPSRSWLKWITVCCHCDEVRPEDGE